MMNPWFWWWKLWTPARPVVVAPTIVQPVKVVVVMVKVTE